VRWYVANYVANCVASFISTTIYPMNFSGFNRKS